MNCAVSQIGSKAGYVVSILQEFKQQGRDFVSIQEIDQYISNRTINYGWQKPLDMGEIKLLLDGLTQTLIRVKRIKYGELYETL